MSREYDLYLENHKANVKKGFDRIKENLLNLIVSIGEIACAIQI